MLKVEIDKILPVTEARANIARLVDEVCQGNVYVLTRGGKPAVMVVPIDYLEKQNTGQTPEKTNKLPAEKEKTPQAIQENKKDKTVTAIDLDKVDQALTTLGKVQNSTD